MSNPSVSEILRVSFILGYGKFNTTPTDTHPLLTCPLKGEEHNDFPPLQGEAAVQSRNSKFQVRNGTLAPDGGGGVRWLICLKESVPTKNSLTNICRKVRRNCRYVFLIEISNEIEFTIQKHRQIFPFQNVHRTETMIIMPLKSKALTLD